MEYVIGRRCALNSNPDRMGVIDAKRVRDGVKEVYVSWDNTGSGWYLRTDVRLLRYFDYHDTLEQPW